MAPKKETFLENARSTLSILVGTSAMLAWILTIAALELIAGTTVRLVIWQFDMWRKK